MSELREALDHILVLCNESRTYTRRTQTIHEVAMQGLGMTKNQRQERHMAVMRRIGGDALVAAYRERCAKRAAKIDAKVAEAATQSGKADTAGGEK